MDLGAMTWTDLDDPIVAVPVGSCEQHGPHLPLHTDTLVALSLARALAARRTDCVVAPPLNVTASGEHAGFPGTLSIGTATTTQVVVELVRSADWARGVVLVNGHGGNAEAMRAASQVLSHEGRGCLAWWPRLRGDLHAGHVETSLMLAIAPEEVRLDRREPGPTPPVAELAKHGVAHFSPNGVLGDPTDADPDTGARLHAELVEQLVDAVDGWAR